jgi:hypothetical protein
MHFGIAKVTLVLSIVSTNMPWVQTALYQHFENIFAGESSHHSHWLTILRLAIDVLEISA